MAKKGYLKYYDNMDADENLLEGIYKNERGYISQKSLDLIHILLAVDWVFQLLLYFNYISIL